MVGSEFSVAHPPTPGDLMRSRTTHLHCTPHLVYLLSEVKVTARMDVLETSFCRDVYNMCCQFCPLSKCYPLVVSISDA